MYERKRKKQRESGSQEIEGKENCFRTAKQLHNNKIPRFPLCPYSLLMTVVKNNNNNVSVMKFTLGFPDIQLRLRVYSTLEVHVWVF